MATRPGTIEFEHVGIGTALKRSRLAVPLNQREYAWEDTHVLDLFHDLANAIDSRKSTYFLGTIVLTQGRDGILEVADGQQRLATTTVLLAAIRDYFQDRNDALLVQSLNEFLFTIVRETRETNPRLRLNVDDNAFFRSRILALKGSPERRAARPQKPSHHRLERAATLAEEHVQNIIRPHSDPNRFDRLNTWVNYIENSASVILLRVPDDLNAYVMFETLNDRGLRTSQSDLVKNYLFSRAEDRLPEAQQKWASMNGSLDTLEDDDITITYLRHLLIALWGHTREREVFERVKEKVQAKQQAIEFLDALSESANDYVALLMPTHAKWNAYNPNIREHIRMMGFLQLAPLRPLMLAVTKRFSRRQTELAFRQFVCWAVRFLIAGGARSGAVEEALARAAHEVSTGHIRTGGQLVDQLIDVLPTDQAFEAAFATATVSRNMLARYYLRALELRRQGNPEPEWIPNDNVVITLEHVLPENPSVGWPNLDPAITHVYHRRIGNMVLLGATQNNVIGNRPFNEKQQTLMDSTFLLTQEVGNSATWGPAEIDERQRRLAQSAVQTWPLRAAG